MTLATVALFAKGPTAIRNIYNWRVKETDWQLNFVKWVPRL
jgi:3-phosphoshikimate 1-carboxyvinyltransferase